MEEIPFSRAGLSSQHPYTNECVGTKMVRLINLGFEGQLFYDARGPGMRHKHIYGLNYNSMSDG